MGSKPFSRGGWVAGGILAGLVGTFVLAGVVPYWRASSQLHSEIRERQEAATEAVAQSQQLLDLTQKARLLSLSARNYDRLVPDNKDLGTFLGELSHELDAAGMQNTAVKALSKTILGKCEQWPIEVHGSGTFAQVHRFLRRLENLPRLSSVSRLNIEADPTMNGAVTVELTLSIYNTRATERPN